MRPGPAVKLREVFLLFFAMEDVQAAIEKHETINATKKKSLTRDDIMRL